MKANIGKIFEKNFKEAMEKTKSYVMRIKDTDSSFNPTQTSKFTTKNPFDFLMYNGTHLYGLELKCTTYSSIGIDREEQDKKMIKLHQIKGLTELSLHNNTIAGFVFCFKREVNDIEKVYFLSIQDFNQFYTETDKKSINEADIVMYNGIAIPTIKKRKYFTYDVDKMIEDVEKYLFNEEKEVIF